MILDAGYYKLLVRYDPSLYPSDTVIFTWQTDSYPCPFNPSFPDYYKNFQGCSNSQSPQKGYPCKFYNQNTKQCTGCIEGYTLISGFCQIGTECPQRHYYKFGKCIKVSDLCLDFDYFTGDCVSCQDALNYDLVKGICVVKQVQCGVRQWKKDSTCFDVSQSCGSFDATNGKCLNCVSRSFQLNTDGTCTKIVIVCQPGQYIDGLECINIPVDCDDFDLAFKICRKCIIGYNLDFTGKCTRLQCPQGEFPSPT